MPDLSRQMKHLNGAIYGCKSDLKLPIIERQRVYAERARWHWEVSCVFREGLSRGLYRDTETAVNAYKHHAGWSESFYRQARLMSNVAYVEGPP